MKRTLVIVCTLLAAAGCQRSDREEQATSPTMLPPPATDMGTPRNDPSALDPTLNPPASTMERQNVSGTDDPAAGTAPGAATQNTSDRVLSQRVSSTAYIWHNYGKSTIGARSDLENVPIDRLQAFYKNYYQPDNSVLLVAGKFDPARTLALVAQKFGAIPRPTRVLPKIYTDEPTQDGERMVTVRRTGDVQLVMASYHVPAGAHPDFAAVDARGV